MQRTSANARVELSAMSANVVSEGDGILSVVGAYELWEGWILL